MGADDGRSLCYMRWFPKARGKPRVFNLPIAGFVLRGDSWMKG